MNKIAIQSKLKKELLDFIFENKRVFCFGKANKGKNGITNSIFHVTLEKRLKHGTQKTGKGMGYENKYKAMGLF